ncbi:MAG TPA: hypothetical protein VFC24_09035 [Casimicrobiaceae bacterium]|nr:hypothetical protein [Casimicrobiaceae bacterium]
MADDAARHPTMATTYMFNRVVNGDDGVAIAYCSVLIALMPRS